MTKQGEQLLQAALHLDEDERAEMVSRLMETLVPSAADTEIEHAWDVEIERRARRVFEQGAGGADGDTVLGRVRRDIVGD